MLRLVPLLLALIAVGCTPKVRALHFTPRRAPLPGAAEISVWSVELPQCPFEEVGLVTVVEEWFSGPDRFLDMLKAEARAMGGHALIALHDFSRPKRTAARGVCPPRSRASRTRVACGEVTGGWVASRASYSD